MNVRRLRSLLAACDSDAEVVMALRGDDLAVRVAEVQPVRFQRWAKEGVCGTAAPAPRRKRNAVCLLPPEPEEGVTVAWLLPPEPEDETPLAKATAASD